MARFDEAELVAEAGAELREEVTAAVAETREALPVPETLLAVEDEDLTGVLDGVRADLAADEAAAALGTARKRFAIGRRAEVFDAEFTEQVEEDLAELQEGVVAVREAAEAAGALSEAVATVRLVQAEVGASADAGAAAGEATEGGSGEPAAGEVDDAVGDVGDDEVDDGGDAADEEDEEDGEGGGLVDAVVEVDDSVDEDDEQAEAEQATIGVEPDEQ
jgi:hypothetical protein